MLTKITKSTIFTRIKPWFFVAPGLIFVIWLRIIPMLSAINMSLYNYDPVNPPGEFIGLKNYIYIFGQEAYWNAWKNTFWFFVFTMLFTFFIPIFQAIFIYEIKKGRDFFTTIYLLPAMIPGTITVILWKWIWNPDYGLMNQFVRYFGLSEQLWLSDPKLVKFAILFPGIIGGGISVLLYLAAIFGISEDIFEAAKVDGCTGWKKVWYIIFPNIKFVISVQFLITLIAVMQLMDAPFQYTYGGPAGSSTTMGIYIYRTAYDLIDFGTANAAAVVLFIVILSLSVIQYRYSNRRDSNV